MLLIIISCLYLKFGFLHFNAASNPIFSFNDTICSFERRDVRLTLQTSELASRSPFCLLPVTEQSASVKQQDRKHMNAARLLIGAVQSAHVASTCHPTYLI